MTKYIRPHFRPRAAALTSFTPLEIAALYGFPSGDGAGQTIAILEFGGGFDQNNLNVYYGDLGVAPNNVVVYEIEGAANSPGSPDGADGEVYLDLCIVGAICPKAKVICIFANTFAGGITAALNAGADVISISWGAPEDGWDPDDMTATETALAAAGVANVTIAVASGDAGSGDGLKGDHVDYPAASTLTLGCGGTSLTADPTKKTILNETVWDDGDGGGSTGGGVSDKFRVPPWQRGDNLTNANRSYALDGRGVPDVAGVADPDTGWKVYGGVIGGTSAVAPMWAALIALLQARRGGRIPNFVNALYAHPEAFNDITSGDNGVWDAAKGWDACTGLGSPKGAVLAALFGVAP